MSGLLTSRLPEGFARAVCPVSAGAISTPKDGLIAGEVAIPTGDGEIPGYSAMPEKGKTFPVVLVVQEIFGVHEHIKDVCRRLAKAGYLAIAPDLYVRQGDVSKLQDIQEIRDKVVSKVPDSQVMSDLDSTANWAEKTGKGDLSRLAITGFCWGGRAVWLYAAHTNRVRSGAAWYGQLLHPANEFRTKTALDVAGSLKFPVLGLYGGQDAGIPLEQVEAMRAALKAAASPSEIVVYPDAQHGFNADYRPSYNDAAAKDAWRRMLDWFKKFGAA
ncbi:MAG TPA: dienelactone hydrolase family protein [Bryobacteraceae bacterium]|nr:dienelactone hydrolase family protein [Bryobacteraceae bacterium]